MSLDLFHAIQRVTRKMPKRHAMYYACINDFKMVFRSPTDIGKKRQQKTPCSAVTLQQLDDFTKKWRRCSINGWFILNDHVLKDISALKIHITRGCLANLLPGMGTNRNENLHRHINPHFSNRSRIGLPIALALLTILLYRHNLSILEKMNGGVFIHFQKWGHECDTLNSSPMFGVQKKDACAHNMSWLFSSIDIESLSHTYLRDACMNACLDESVLLLVSIQDITDIVENALGFTKIALFMQKQSSKSPAFNYKYLTLMSSVASLFFHSCPADDHLRNQQRLDNVLAAWGMVRHSIDGDGNCCFSSVAFSLINNSTLILESNPGYFSTIGLDAPDDIQCLSTKLRQLTVLEWVHNHQEYEGFTPDVNVVEEAEKFLQDGFFHGELADTIVLALSNLLGVPLIIFSSSASHPVITITPRQLKIPVPLYLAYNQYGAGHYDAAVLYDDNNVKSLASPRSAKMCSCGKLGRGHCTKVDYKYTTTVHCPCFKENRACTEKCKCTNCQNSYGSKYISLPSRKRPRQQYQIKVPKSGLDAGELITSGPKSMFQFFLLQCVLRHCTREGIELSSENIATIFNAIVEIADTQDICFPLERMSTERIDSFLREHTHLVTVFKALCLAKLHSEYNP